MQHRRTRLQETENDDENDVLDDDIDVSDIASTIINESVPASARLVQPALTSSKTNSQNSNRDYCPSTVPSWHEDESFHQSDQVIQEAAHPSTHHYDSYDDVITRAPHLHAQFHNTNEQ